MLEFVSAQTGLPVVAVGGGSSLGREPQVRGILAQPLGLWVVTQRMRGRSKTRSAGCFSEHF